MKFWLKHSVEVSDFRVANLGRKIFWKKFGHVKNIEGKAPVVSKRPWTSLGLQCRSSSSSTLLQNGNVETTNSRGEHGRPMPWLTQRTGKNVFCDRVGTDFNVFDCRGSFCELPFLQNSKIRWYSRKPIETSFIKDSLRKPYMYKVSFICIPKKRVYRQYVEIWS